MPPTRRIAFAAAVALCAGLTLVVAAAGLQHRSDGQGDRVDRGHRHRRGRASSAAPSPSACAWPTGASPSPRRTSSRSSLRAERLAREGVAAEPDETEFLDLDPYDDDDFEELVRDALDDLPDLLRNLVENHNVAVVISDGGRRRRAYGLYHGDGATRDEVPDRIVIYRDTLRRDFGHDPDLLREPGHASPCATSSPTTSASTSSACATSGSSCS